MANYYTFTFCSGLYVDGPVAADEVFAFQYSKDGTIAKVYAVCVNEAVASDTQDLKIDVGTIGDDDSYIASYIIPDNSLEAAVIDMTSSLLSTSYTAGTKMMLSIDQECTSASTASGQIQLIVELKVAATAS